MSRSMTRDELVELATFLFGPKWQTPLAEQLKTDRRSLVRDLAAEKPISTQTAQIVLFLVDQKIEKMLREYGALVDRVERLKKELAVDLPRRTVRTSGREIAS